jgi:RHS repeat-associated protein
MELILQHPEFVTATFYVRDASGNVMAVYKTSGTTNLTLEEQHIYGSSRLGIFKKDKTIKNKARALGERQYELTDHLGNVRVVLSDYKKAESIVLSATDYYPFGMVARTYTSPEEYRYGFNGKESDDETGWQDYGMRIYSPVLCRFFRVDPITKEYPELTPYQFASNTPIWAIDFDGLEASYTTINNVNFVVLKNANVSFIVRESQQSFTQAAAQHNSNAVDYSANLQQYETTSTAASASYALGPSEPQPVEDYRAQGYVVECGKVIAGRSSPKTFYFAQNANTCKWVCAQGDVPSGSYTGFGGGIPVYVGGLKYGDKNLYTSDAPANLPQTGPPGVDNKYLLQRSNAGYASQNDATVGKTVIGYNSKTNTWVLVVQEEGIKGMTLDQIRDKLIADGFDNILSFDGSTSATMVKDKQTIVTPSTRKNNTIPTGITFTVTNPKPTNNQDTQQVTQQ